MFENSIRNAGTINMHIVQKLDLCCRIESDRLARVLMASLRNSLAGNDVVEPKNPRI